MKIFKGPGEYFKIERFSRWCVFETERVHCKLHKLLPFHKDFLNKVNYFNEIIILNVPITEACTIAVKSLKLGINFFTTFSPLTWKFLES